MDTLDYLMEVSKSCNVRNDSAIADLLEVRPATVSRYRKFNSVMSDDVCERVSKLTGIELEKILVDMQIMSSPNPTVKKAWSNLAMTISIVWVSVCILCKIIHESVFVRKSSEISI